MFLTLRDEYIDKIKNASTDDERKLLFPWKRNMFSDDDIRDMMAKLRSYYANESWKRRIRREPFRFPNISLPNTTFEQRHTLIVSEKSDYLDWNILSDMFNEENRLQASLKGEQAPYTYFFENIEKILAHSYKIVSDYDIREKIYETRLECTSFRPNIMATLVGMFKSTNVLDFSSGWGDRLISAIACDVDYTGIDPNTNLQKNYEDIRSFFGVSDTKFRTLVGQAEHMNDILNVDEKFDLVFTSPPYFNYEIYSNSETQSISNFSTEDAWFEHFLAPAITQAWSHLVDEGYFAININQTNKTQTYVTRMIDLINSFDDSTYVGVIGYVNEYSFKSPQPIFVWKKSVNIINYITSFERARVITTRAYQLLQGKFPHPSVPLEELKYDVVRIASYEYYNNLIENLVIQREVLGRTCMKNVNEFF